MSSAGFQPVSARINSQRPSRLQLLQEDHDEEARADIAFLQIAIDVLMRRGMTYEDILTAISRAANADQRVRASPRHPLSQPAWRG